MCGFLMFLPPLSETTVGGATGDGSVSAPEICDTLVQSVLKANGKWTVVVAYIILSIGPAQRGNNYSVIPLER